MINQDRGGVLWDTEKLGMRSGNVGCPGSAILAVGAVSWMLMGSLWAAATLAAVIAALLVQLAGLLPVLGMQLNAVSLVNLAMVWPRPNVLSIV